MILVPTVTLPDGSVLRHGAEVRANRRRTRLTSRGTLDGAAVYIKTFRGLTAPLKGSITAKKARALRQRAPGAAPDLLYAGPCGPGRWLLIYEAIDAAETLAWLKAGSAPSGAWPTTIALVDFVADLHDRGIVQPDTNLTNFVCDEARLWMLDDDDLKFSASPVTPSAGLGNLASVLARIPWLTDDDHNACFARYCHRRKIDSERNGAFQSYLASVRREQAARIRKHAGK